MKLAMYFDGVIKNFLVGLLHFVKTSQFKKMLTFFKVVTHLRLQNILKHSVC